MDAGYLECATDMPAPLDDVSYTSTLEYLGSLIDKAVYGAGSHELWVYKNSACYAAPADRSQIIWEIHQRATGALVGYCSLEDGLSEDLGGVYSIINIDDREGVKNLKIEIDGTEKYESSPDERRPYAFLPVISADRKSRWWNHNEGFEPATAIVLVECAVDPVALSAIANVVSIEIVCVETSRPGAKVSLFDLNKVSFATDSFTTGVEAVPWLEFTPTQSVREVECRDLEPESFGGLPAKLRSIFPGAAITCD